MIDDWQSLRVSFLLESLRSLLLEKFESDLAMSQGYRGGVREPKGARGQLAWGTKSGLHLNEFYTSQTSR